MPNEQSIEGPALRQLSQRHLFDVPEGVSYFNTAYNSPLLRTSRDRLVQGAKAKAHPWERTADDFFADAEQCRVLAGELFGGGADGYAVIPAVSYGISAAARILEPTLGPGDVILLLDEEFPSNVLPWRRVALERGAEVQTVPTPENGDWTEAILSRLSPAVRVLAAPHCHWTNGARLDLARIGQAARDTGVTLVLDVSQSLGAMPLDLDAVQPDFMVAAGYKWLLCPYGFGLMYVAPWWRNARPLEESWLAREGSSDLTALVRYSDQYRPGARRFDVGEASVTTVAPGAMAALEQLRAWTVAGIGASLAEITDHLAAGLAGLGLDVTPFAFRCPHMFGASLGGELKGDVVSRLRERQIYVSQRGASLRIAPHLHVTSTDVDRLLEAVEDLVAGR